MKGILQHGANSFLYRMSSRRNIRKRQFEANKALRLYRDYQSLYYYLNGENADEANLSTFEANEKYENNNKIAEMFLKKKKNVIIPAINYENKDEKGNNSERSANTEITQMYKKEEKGPVKFEFKPISQIIMRLLPRVIMITQHSMPVNCPIASCYAIHPMCDWPVC